MIFGVKRLIFIVFPLFVSRISGFVQAHRPYTLKFAKIFIFTLMKRFWFLLLLVVPFAGFGNLSDNDPDFGIIKGQVSTSDNKPAAGVTVIVKGSRLNAITDDDGQFAIYKVAPGTYDLEVSLIGYETLSQSVTIEKGNITAVSMQLTLSNSQLKEVIVTHSKNRYADKKSVQVARLPLRNLENPQVYNVVGSSLMAEQVVTERTDVFRNVPGGVPNFSSGGSQGLTMRGFQNNMGMRNGMVTSAVVQMNPAILESIEFIKGPSGTLFGSSRNVTFGGVYNYVTKKPYEEFGGEISYAGGSFKFNRFSADINTPLNKTGNALFRIVAVGQSERSFQDQGYSKNYTIAPSFKYIVNDRLSFTVEAEITRGDYTTSYFALGNLNNITARNFKDLPLGYKRSLISNDANVNNGINNLQAQVEYKISNQWKSQTNYLYSEGFYKHLFWTTLTLQTDSTVARSVRNQTPETFGNIQVQQNFIGDFRIGSLRNRVVIGLDYNYNYNELNRVTIPYDVVKLHQPIPVMSADKLKDLSHQIGFTSSVTKTNTYSIYASDVLNITPSLMAMLSLRFDRFNTDGTLTPATGKYTGGYNQSSWSPKLGLVYQVVKDQVSVFGNYMNGFVNLGPSTQPDGSILELKPQYGNQWEGGVKVEVLRNKLSGTVSVYDIAVTNSTRTEVRDGKNWTIQDGTQHSKGVEVEVIANPVAGLNIISGYAFNENKYKKATPALQGKFVTASPQHVGNLWVSYALQKGKAKGFGAAVGVNYVGDSWFEVTNQFKLPSYTLLSGSIFYDQPTYRITLKGNNLLDEQYWNLNGTPQKPINFLVSIGFKF